MVPKNAFVIFLASIFCLTSADYEVGVGIADMTGPPAEINFMGYANLGQTGSGIHLRQFARTFIIVDGSTRIAFVSCDAAMMGNGLRDEVIRLLTKSYGTMYNDSNLILSSTHSHSTPGGFMMDMLFDITILGFVKETFTAYANGIVRSIQMAHETILPAKIFYNEGRVENANINRSPTSYLLNPEEERAKYPDGDTDKKLAQIKFVSAQENTLIGAINWFSVHPTSMNNTNTLISSDNLGYASILLEQAINPPGTFPGKGKFVGAFSSTNLGDVSPNIKGPTCEFTGEKCDIFSSRCKDPKDKCFASGPGKNMYESTRIIASRIEKVALKTLLDSNNAVEITGPIKSVHQYIDMTKQNVPVYDPITGTFNNKTIGKGCLPAMGYSFAAGTTDGPGAFNFSQGTISGNPLWDSVRDLLAEPTKEDIECQSPKPILLATGRIKFPYRWQPTIASSQLAVIGNFVIAAIPGEFTTMSGRRMRQLLTDTFAEAGRNVKVVIAGLSNSYTDYIVTYEEYQAQRYEAASTIYGPHTLSIHLNQYYKLAKAIINDEVLDPGVKAEDIKKELISLVPPVIFDIAPWENTFGDCILQPEENYKKGETVHVRFISGNPRNNLMTERSYLVVEKYDNSTSKWATVALDSSWETRFVWERTSLILGTSRVNIFWDVTSETAPGVYRIKHTGYFRYIFGLKKPYQGVSKQFNVVES